MRVLLLDDDPDFCEVLRAVIEWHGHYELVVAHRGVDAVHEVHTTDFDVILCDMVMPGMSGEIFYLAVQHLKPKLCRRFVFITGHSDEPEIARFLALVGNRVLRKPLNTDELMIALGEVVSENARIRIESQQ
jgi:CheY-like chemotaxis protein